MVKVYLNRPIGRQKDHEQPHMSTKGHVRKYMNVLSENSRFGLEKNEAKLMQN